MTAFAAFATGFCQKNSVSLCKGTKLKTVCRFSPWNVFPPMKPAFFFPNSAPLNSGLWLTAFDKSEFFRCQNTFATRFCLRHCVSLCKGTKLQKAGLFAIERRSFMEGSCFCFCKAGENSTFSKVVKHQGKGVLAQKQSSLVQTPCAKTAKSYAFCVIRRSRILGQYAGFRFGMFFRQ